MFKTLAKSQNKILVSKEKPVAEKAKVVKKVGHTAKQRTGKVKSRNGA